MNGLLCIFAASVIGMGPTDGALDSNRLEQFLNNEDDAMVTQIFRRHPDQTLSFIDQYLEGGLKMVEEGKPYEDSMASFRLGVKFAQLADKAHREQIFEEYAASFAGWSAAEQKMFRAGQMLYREGKKLESSDSAAALVKYEMSLAQSEPLFDHWGEAMALGGMARVHLGNQDYDKAIEFADKAQLMNRRLRLRIAEIRVLLVAAAAEKGLERRNAGLGRYARAWQIIKETDDPDLRHEVLIGYIIALESIGQLEMAQELRAKELPNIPTTQPEDES